MKDANLSPASIDTVAEDKLIRKLDLHIMPLVMCLYLFVGPAVILLLLLVN